MSRQLFKTRLFWHMIAPMIVALSVAAVAAAQTGSKATPKATTNSKTPQQPAAPANAATPVPNANLNNPNPNLNPNANINPNLTPNPNPNTNPSHSLPHDESKQQLGSNIGLAEQQRFASDTRSSLDSVSQSVRELRSRATSSMAQKREELLNVANKLEGDIVFTQRLLANLPQENAAEFARRREQVLSQLAEMKASLARIQNESNTPKNPAALGTGP